jgi:hypothetical protein
MFDDNKMIALIFKIVNKLDNIRVLTHLENINFSSLLVDFDYLHISFSRSLYSDSLSIKEVSTL